MKRYLLIAAVGYFSFTAHGQGCADAGFCTAGALKPVAAGYDSGRVSGSAGLSFTAGVGEQGVLILLPQLELSRNFDTRTAAEIKLPYYLASGDLGIYSGVGDLIVSITRILTPGRTATQLAGTFGARISLGAADKTGSGLQPLPMPYQPNLGTSDLIAGISLRYRKNYVMNVAIQQPLIQYNDNGHYAAAAGTPPDYAAYFSSRKLRRKGDVLLRLEYERSRKRFGIATGALFLYHLGQDEITTPAGVVNKVSGSEGLTLNLTFNYYRNYANWRFEAGLGAPVIVRDTRPDGLTRALVFTPRVTWFFKKKTS